MTDIQKLKALAQKQVNPANWFQSGEIVEGVEPEDLEYIAAANPAAVLELIAELEDQALQTRSARDVCVESQGTILTLIAERDQLKAENERLQRFETSYKEFSDKTDWVRPNAAAHELGMHVADVIRKRCGDLTSHNQAQADEIVRLRKDQVEAISDYNATVDRKDKFIGECDQLKTENAALRKFIIELAQDDAQIAYAYAAICGEQQL